MLNHRIGGRARRPISFGTVAETPYSSASPTVYYPLSNATDTGGGSRTLTPTGSISFPAGKVGNCASYSVSANHTRASDAGFALNSSTRSLSVAFWVKSGNDGVFLAKYGGLATCGWEASTTFGATVVNVNIYQNDGTVAANLTGAYTANSWVHFIFVIDRTLQVARLYRNGALDETSGDISAILTTVDTQPLVLCGPGLNAGSLDEVGIWVDTALGDDDATFLYNGGSGKTFNGTTWV